MNLNKVVILREYDEVNKNRFDTFAEA